MGQVGLFAVQPRRVVPALPGCPACELSRLDELVGARRKVKRQHNLYRAGDPFEAIYAIRAGSFKTDVLLEDGREQVTGFQMTGEILGLDGISTESTAATRSRSRTARSA